MGNITEATIEDALLAILDRARQAGMTTLAGGIEVAIEEATEAGEIA